MRGRARAVGAWIAAAWLLPAVAVAAPAQGPLGLRTPGTVRDLFLDVVLWDARAVEAPRLELCWAMANDWSTPTRLERGTESAVVWLDEQADSLSASIRIPWGVVAGAPEGSFARRLASALELRATLHWGGWSDAPIEAWHGLVRYYGFARKSYPRDAVNLELRAPAVGTLARVEAPTLAVGDVVLRNQVLLWEGGEPLASGSRARAGVSLRLDVKAPLGRTYQMGGSGGWDAGVGLAGTWQAPPWLVGHALAAASWWSGFSAAFPLQPLSWHGSLEASLVFLVGEWSFILEDRFLTKAFGPGWTVADEGPGGTLQSSASHALFRPQNQIALGARIGPVTFWFAEDFVIGSNPIAGTADWFYDTNAPDVAVGLSLTIGR